MSPTPIEALAPSGVVAVLPALPLMVPLFSAIACLLAWRRPTLQRAIGVGGAVVLLLAAGGLLAVVLEVGPLVLHTGGWQPPVAISLIADPLSALMVAVTAVVALASAVYALGDIDRRHMAHGFFPLFHFLIMAVCGAFLTGDMFNLFVWFEVMLIASFVLMGMGGQRLQMSGAIKYVAINLVSSALFLVAVGMLYAVCHSLSMADIPVRLALVAETHPDLVLVLAALVAVAFSIKAGLFPLFSWLPASYHTPPVAISALFAGLLTKVGVYSLLRVFGAVFPPLDVVYSVVLVIAGLTMLTGVVGAVGQGTVRRILSFHIISQIGYIVIGVGLLGALDGQARAFAVAAAVFYTVHHILVKTNLFFAAGVIERLGGSGRLDALGGLARRAPLLAVLFLIPALSLAGVPPLSGFWAKLAVFQALIAGGHYLLVAAAAVAGLLTLVSMMKIWNGAFWQPAPAGASPSAATPLSGSRRVALFLPMIALAGLTVAIGLAPQSLFEWAERAATMPATVVEPGSGAPYTSLGPGVHATPSGVSMP